ncbi:MAG: ribosome-associated translation inhibitor RaiA [Nitrospinaceae bacterium]|jgi:putative sigma-54 modulation protein|nr:ribosome-associated translation inhibitor RaiA [Nitrospinaceae bacterium]|tara:strand:- start:565 stop:894 length:330 start_codon:yes stop_codon:yes gene_type:complete
MKLTVTGRNLEITEAIKSHLENKMKTTIQELGEKASVHVALQVEKHRRLAEITVQAKGFTAHTKEETKDLYSAMDNALNKVEQQLRKHNERAKDLRIKQGTEEKNRLTD